jgi:hypothetical protein
MNTAIAEKKKTPILRTSVESLEQMLKKKAEIPPTLDDDFAVVRRVMPLIEKALDNKWYLDDLVRDFREAGIDIEEERLKRLIAVAKREREKTQ